MRLCVRGRSGQSGCWNMRKDTWPRAVLRLRISCPEGRDLRGFVGAAGDLDRQVTQPFVAHDLPTDQEGVAGGQGCGKGFLDLAQRLEAALAGEP